jgi:trehalose/maltose transport system permease protein
MIRTGRNAKRVEWLGWLLTSPSIAVLLLIGAYPLLQTLWFSFTNAYFASSTTQQFIGLRNYRLLFTDPDFWRALLNTAIFTFVSVTVEFCIGLAIALLLHSRMRGRAFFRACMLIPWAIPTVIAARIWGYMLVDTYGVVNDLLFTRLHLIDQKIAWLARPVFSMIAIIAVDVWKTTPFVALLLLAGMQTIPRDVCEAAEVDGAKRFQRLRFVIIPMLKPAILVALVFRTLDALRVFDVIWVLTRGELGTESLATYTYRYLVDYRRTGYGSAASVAIFITISVFVAIYVKLLKEPEQS